MKCCENCIHFKGYSNIEQEECFICELLPNHLIRKNIENCNFYNVDISKERICLNCKYFLGGNDWGLACLKDYYYLPRATSKMCKDGEYK